MATADAKIRIVAEDKTQKAFKSVDKNLNKTSDALKGLAKRFVLAAGAAGVGGFIKSTIDGADKLDKLSKRLDIGVKALSEYKHVADLGGVSFETMTMGMQRLTRRVAEAAGGFGEAKGALAELGLDAAKLNELPLDQKFELIADKLAGLGSESDRVRLAMKLFDSEGVALIQTMEGGAEGIRKMRQQARELGLTLDSETTKAAAKFKDNVVILKGTLQGMANQVLPTVLKALNKFTEVLRDTIAILKEWGKQLKLILKALIALYIGRKLTVIFYGLSAALKAVQFSAMGAATALSAVVKVAKRNVVGILIALGTTMYDLFRNTEDMTEATEDLTHALEPVVVTAEKVNDEFTETNDLIAKYRSEVLKLQGEKSLEKAMNPIYIEEINKLFEAGKIDVETYREELEKLGVEGPESLTTLKEHAENMFDGIRSAWSTMWEGLFTGRGIESVKDFMKQVKDIFLKTLAEIAAQWTWQKIFGNVAGGTAGDTLISAITSIFGKAGESGGDSFISTIGAALKAGAGKVGSLVSSIFGGGGFSSSGALVPGAAGGFQTVGANAATTFMGGLKTTLSGMAGFAVPLAIAAFGFGKSRQFRKQLRAKFALVMSDPEIVANLADGPLAGGFKILGQVGDETFAQIGSASAKMFREFSETSGGVFGNFGGQLDYAAFGLKEMHDEFGNVVVTAGDFNGLLEYMKEMEPFSNHAQHLMDTIPAYQIAKDNISLIDSELLKVKVQFKNMGEEAKTALGKVDMGSQRVANIMQREFVTAADFAAMGMENLGSMSSSMFEKLIAFAQDASGEMQNLATMANRSAAATQGAMDLKHAAGFQHGGSFLVGGGGGTDSQRVSFMATPGERVSIETPNQSKASGSDGSGVVRELRALRHDLATVVAKPIVGAVTRGQLAMAGGARH